MAKEYLYTPPGILGDYPALDRVDYYKDTDGKYKCDLIFNTTNKDVKAFVKKMDDLMPSIMEAKEKYEKAQLKKGDKVELDVNPMYKYVYSEEGEKTDQIKVGFKTKASGTNKTTGEAWARSFNLVDGSGKRIAGKIGIGGGSKAIVKYTLGTPYAIPKVGCGITKYLEGAQLLELVKFGDDGGGFAPVEDGYSFDEDDVTIATNTATEVTQMEEPDDLPSFAS